MRTDCSFYDVFGLNPPGGPAVSNKRNCIPAARAALAERLIPVAVSAESEGAHSARGSEKGV